MENSVGLVEYPDCGVEPHRFWRLLLALSMRLWRRCPLGRGGRDVEHTVRLVGGIVLDGVHRCSNQGNRTLITVRVDATVRLLQAGLLPVGSWVTHDIYQEIYIKLSCTVAQTGVHTFGEEFSLDIAVFLLRFIVERAQIADVQGSRFVGTKEVDIVSAFYLAFNSSRPIREMLELGEHE